MAAIAEQCLDQSVRSTDQEPILIGVGSGDLVAEFLRASSIIIEDRSLGSKVAFVPTSLSAASELKMLDLKVKNVATAEHVNVFVDQPDQVHVVDPFNVYYVVGSGDNGLQIGQPDIKLVQKAAQSSTQWCLLTHYQGDVRSARLSGQLSVLIDGDELEWEECAEEVDDIFLGDAEITRRSNSENANTRGFPDPVITSENNMILDVLFYEDFRLYGQSEPYEIILDEMLGIEGVVTTGLIGPSKKPVVINQFDCLPNSERCAWTMTYTS
jgi:ribose 5-phosphate isomerase A